ncbi:hypothetical protein RRG08_017969 [Elysia crispata]|uniref:Uncharacterized protein n=1 Tax=Elysia crispata TaxID=231223 RepID=A0AAE0ZDB0_9GAST|nr:hypothetical protein RRG08_017969 [Elysia crispata]
MEWIKSFRVLRFRFAQELSRLSRLAGNFGTDYENLVESRHLVCFKQTCLEEARCEATEEHCEADVSTQPQLLGNGWSE